MKQDESKDLNDKRNAYAKGSRKTIGKWMFRRRLKNHGDIKGHT